MRLDPIQRTATGSVREFAEFRLGPGRESEHRASRWRMEAGRQWHEALRREIERSPAAGHQVRAEVGIEVTLPLAGWLLTIQGRIDQLIDRPEGPWIREVKTVRRALPRPPDELRQDFPDYFAQTALYAYLWDRRSEAPHGQTPTAASLIFVDIDDGLQQSIALTPEEIIARFEAQAAVWSTFLQSRARSHERLRHLQWTPPFASLRPGQSESRHALAAFTLRGPRLCFEAPTGFGKTGLVLEHALERLRSGMVDRVIYLTGKSTGQIQVTLQLRQMCAAHGGLRFHQMRNRAEHMQGMIIRPIADRRDGLARWTQAGMDPEALLDQGPLDLAQLQRLSRETELPAYDIARALLPHADVWIGDYNYLFAPGVSGLFWDQPAFAPGRTLLIVDEAHNLAARTADAWSAELTLGELYTVLMELRSAGIGGKLMRALENLESFLRPLPVCAELEGLAEYELIDHLSAVAESVERLPWDPDALTAEAYERLWNLSSFYRRLTHQGLDRLLWSPSAGELRLTCLDAVSELAPRLNAFAEVLLLSATMRPHDAFCRSLGCTPHELPLLEASAPWRNGAYRVAVDTRVDTRFRTREQHLTTTAETLGRMCVGGLLPVAVFLPSYRYAEALRRACAAMDPGLRLALPPRGMCLGEQESFIESSLMDAHALLLVLGTGYTEGVDMLGGRVQRALMVGPALPEVNPVQEARMARGGPREQAFRSVYLIPGMTKVNQALGRLVRAPGHHAEVVLHCRRFQDADYASLLGIEYQEGQLLRSRADLDQWLRNGE